MLSLRHLLDRQELLERLVEVIIHNVDLDYSPSHPHSSSEHITFLLSEPKLQALRLGSLVLRYMMVGSCASLHCPLRS